MEKGCGGNDSIVWSFDARAVMYKTILFVFLVGIFLSISCNRRDNSRPVIESFLVEDQASDTLNSLYFPFSTSFLLTDNEGVQEYRLEFVQTSNATNDLQQLIIQSIGSAKSFSGKETIQIETEVLDTLESGNWGFYKLTLDCFDINGNTAIQEAVIVEIVKP
jgi:hypothetical protein